MADSCPHCGYAALRPTSRYCPRCGQAQIVVGRPANASGNSVMAITLGGQPAAGQPPLTVSPPPAPQPGPAAPPPAYHVPIVVPPNPFPGSVPPAQPSPGPASPMVVALSQVYPTVSTGGYNRLERLLLQGEGQVMDERMRARFLEQLRTEIFRFRQTAQSALELAHTQPRLAAAAMSTLFRQLERSGIRPEQFPDLNDKEYIATTFRTVERSRNELLAAISPQTMPEIRDLAEIAAPLPELAYYVNHFDEVWEYRQLVPEYERSAKMVQGLQRTGCLLGAELIVLVPFLGIAALGLLGLIAVFIMEPSPMALLGLLAVAVPVVGVIAYVRKYRRETGSSAEMVERIIEIASSVDLAYFAELERRYGPDKSSVQRRLDDTSQYVRRYFGPYASLFVPG